MKKEKVVLVVSGLVVVSILYLAFKKNSQKGISGDDALKKDYQDLMNKIENAKK